MNKYNLPWKVAELDYRAILDSSGLVAADLRIAPSEGCAEAAAFMVRAVNNHAELLDCLNGMVDALNMARLVMRDQETRDLAGQLVADARSVLAKASGAAQEVSR